MRSPFRWSGTNRCNDVARGRVPAEKSTGNTSAVVATVAMPPEGPAGHPPHSPVARKRERTVSPRSVFVPYARLFRVPGALAFSLAGWLARLPIPMVGLGTVLLVVGETGSYGLAGTLSGVLALSFSIASPQWARAIDRRGQGVVLRLSVACYLVSGVAFAVAVVLGGPHWLWFVLAALTGASEPNIGALVRARWAHALDAEGRRTAFAFESVVDEVVFVVGPPFVTLLATLVAAPAGFLTGLGIGVAGGMWPARPPGAQPPGAGG